MGYENGLRSRATLGERMLSMQFKDFYAPGLAKSGTKTAVRPVWIGT